MATRKRLVAVATLAVALSAAAPLAGAQTPVPMPVPMLLPLPTPISTPIDAPSSAPSVPAAVVPAAATAPMPVASAASSAAPAASAPPDSQHAPSAPAAAAPPLALDLREEVRQLPVTVKDLYGRQETRPMTLTGFRPPGDGPFPLVIISHGRAPAERRAAQGRQRFEALSRYLVSKGFAVFVPTRVGYADTYGDFDPESTGECSRMRVQPAATAASDQVLATVSYARTLPYVDATRWVAMGQSVGGLATLAVVARQPPGLVAAVNFAGGVGGNPERRPGDPCSPQAVQQLWAEQAASAPLPMLWLYWANDLYWGADWPRRWAEAWNTHGGQAQLHQLAAAGTDGHNGLNVDMDHWVPLVEAYLGGAGFAQPGTVLRPPPSGFADVAQADKLPAPPGVRDNLYRRFLASKAPRAFAVGPDGAAGFASGDWALGRALGYCQLRRGAPCQLYAVDDDVVWVP